MLADTRKPPDILRRLVNLMIVALDWRKGYGSPRHTRFDDEKSERFERTLRTLSMADADSLDVN